MNKHWSVDFELIPQSRSALKKMWLKYFAQSLLVFVFIFYARSAEAQTTSVQRSAKENSKIYLPKIKPLLTEKCYSCHNAYKQEGGLRLDAASLILKGGDSGAAFVSKAAGDSLLIERITGDDDDRMPPVEDGPRLSAAEVELLKDWINDGAEAPDEAIPKHPSQHWSYLPPRKSPLPKVEQEWVRSEIDRFLAAEHSRVGVEAVGETSPELLLRRVSIALTGLPPTRAELETYLKDKSDSALENAIDRYLESPRYGERWARHFMDIWRYSDPSGYGDEIRDGRKHIWRWRDWIVESLNQDKSYDQMVIEMLAADEVSPEDQSSLRATGFLARNWYKFNRNVWLDNIVEHSSKAFLGITMNCARCHAHKYDPIEQHSYYQMRAIFETHDVRDDPLQSAESDQLVRTYDAHLDRKTFSFFQGDENKPDKSKALPPGLPELLGELSIKEISLPVTAWYPALQKQNRDQALKVAQAKLSAAEKEVTLATASVNEAQKKLAAFQPPKSNDGNKKSGKNDGDLTKEQSKPSDGKSVLSDDFSKLDLTKWKIESGDWSIKNGRLVQANGLTRQHRLVSLIDHPRDFYAKARLKITGGETYRSVGIGFDGHELAMNSIYLSVAGPKVQFSYQGNDGKWYYPASGAAKLPVNIGTDYLVELLVKDQLLNLMIDGKLRLAYQLPKRTAGRVSLWAFSATAEFDQFDVKTLPKDVVLADALAPKKPRPITKKDLTRSVRVAEVALKVAKLRHRAAQSNIDSLKARIEAELVRYGLSSGNQKSTAKAAGLASRQYGVDQLLMQLAAEELKLAKAQQKSEIGTPAEQAKAASELQTAEKKAAEIQKKLETARAKLQNGAETYEVLGPQYPKTSSGRRLAFARWITDQKNPLAARVIVNHIWLRHFGSPLVERTFDFGLRSEKPRHADLLDWLAVQLIEDGWSLKKLHKRILMSGIYRRSSSSAEASQATRETDPDNLSYWRMNARRMEAEVVRDSVLALGGSLDTTMGGPPIEHTKGQSVLRRSLYFRQDKERQMTFLNLFDGAKVAECYERKSTVAPQQALALFNSQIAAEQAKKIAENYKRLDAAEFVNALFEHVLCRAPSAKEQNECVQFLTSFQGNAESKTQLALVLLNHNDFVTIR